MMWHIVDEILMGLATATNGPRHIRTLGKAHINSDPNQLLLTLCKRGLVHKQHPARGCAHATQQAAAVS